jgi:DNA-directed RNA polymerase
MMTQLELERDAVNRGIDRYFKNQSEAVERNREFDNTVAHREMRSDLELLAKGLRTLRREARAKMLKATMVGTRIQGWEPCVEAMDSQSLAFICMKTLVTAGREEQRVQRVATTIGRMVNLELRWQAARRAETKAAKERGHQPPNRIEMMKRRVKIIDPKSVTKWLKRFDDLNTDVWSKKLQFQVGVVVLKVALEVLPHVVTKRTVYNGSGVTRRSRLLLELTPEFTEKLKVAHEAEALRQPWLLPMIERPKAWSFDDEYAGYYSHPMSIIKSGRKSGSSAKASQRALDAVNRVQDTPWEINNPLLSIANIAVKSSTGPLPVLPLMDMPAASPSDVWAKMSRSERGEIKAKRELVHSHNNRQKAKALAMHRVLVVASEFSQYPQIWFPHNLDWRGRAYPLPQDLHPQADDFSKSLLRFAEGKALGEHGMKWLVFHLANCYGMDKVDRAGQAEWYNDNLDNVFAVASDPMGEGLEFWSQADEPWQFLAAAIEVCQAASLKDPMLYVSHLPVQVDGSCNGLQHLSAMGLDPVGAHAVNLTADPVRQDIYQIVADKVSERVVDDTIRNEDVNNSRVCAWTWRGKVTRKTVKRGVMTTPYGLTSIGMRDQLIKDRWTADLEGDQMANANYMRDRMKEAIGDTIVKGTVIMEWFQDCASILAAEGKPISWVTPMGIVITQEYRRWVGTRINTLLGKMDFNDRINAQGELAKKKQELSIAPNIIHSFDAAHMMLSVLAAPDDFSFSVVHDSFGCHAGDMECFSHILRVEFVKMYHTNWFKVMSEGFHKQGAKYLPAAPERGDFDVEEVCSAEFFFA